MRLDKRVAKALEFTRREARRLIKTGKISVNGQVCKTLGRLTRSGDLVKFADKSLNVPVNRYIMLHKPVGYLSTQSQAAHPSALDLLNPEPIGDLHFVGRLDLNSSGLLLITNDGQWSHRISAPSYKQTKCYRVDLAEELSDLQKTQIEQGLLLKDSDKLTKPAKIEIVSANQICIYLLEGRYHQVRRMFAAVGNHVESLHRTSIGELKLDPQLAQGQWRCLSSQEMIQLG